MYIVAFSFLIMTEFVFVSPNHRPRPTVGGWVGPRALPAQGKMGRLVGGHAGEQVAARASGRVHRLSRELP